MGKRFQGAVEASVEEDDVQAALAAVAAIERQRQPQREYMGEVVGWARGIPHHGHHYTFVDSTRVYCPGCFVLTPIVRSA